MKNEEAIRREDWVAFLDEFSREHQGSEVDLEIAGIDDNGEIEAREVALQGVSADVRNGEQSIAIMVGRDDTPGLTHIVSDAIRLSVNRTAAGNDSGLEIESAAGETTRLRLHAVRQPA